MAEAARENKLMLTTLPREIRHQIISYIFMPESEKSSISILSPKERIERHCRGSCTYFPGESVGCAGESRWGGCSTSSTCTCYHYGLFRVNKMLYEDSTFICFSLNRFRLHGLFNGLTFLQNLPSIALQAMRKVDFVIWLAEYTLFEHQVPEIFVKSIAIIAKNCKLPLLQFRLDAGGSNGVLYVDVPMKNPSLYHKMFWNMARGLIPLGQGKVARLYISLNAFRHEEDDMERMVMGDQYDARALGKFSRYWVDHANPMSYMDSTTSNMSDTSDTEM